MFGDVNDILKTESPCKDVAVLICRELVLVAQDLMCLQYTKTLKFLVLCPFKCLLIRGFLDCWGFLQNSSLYL